MIFFYSVFLFIFSVCLNSKINVKTTTAKCHKEKGKKRKWKIYENFSHAHYYEFNVLYTIIYVEKFVVFRLTVAGETRVACVIFGVDSVSLKLDVDVVIVVICC